MTQMCQGDADGWGVEGGTSPVARRLLILQAFTTNENKTQHLKHSIKEIKT